MEALAASYYVLKDAGAIITLAFGNLITGQNPASSEAVAKAVLTQLVKL